MIEKKEERGIEDRIDREMKGIERGGGGSGGKGRKKGLNAKTRILMECKMGDSPIPNTQGF